MYFFQLLDNELNVRVGMASNPTQLPSSVAYVNHRPVLQTNNVHLDSHATTNFANLFVTVTQIVFPTSFATETCAKRFVEKMGTVTLMRFVKEFNV